MNINYLDFDKLKKIVDKIGLKQSNVTNLEDTDISTLNDNGIYFCNFNCYYVLSEGGRQIDVDNSLIINIVTNLGKGDKGEVTYWVTQIRFTDIFSMDKFVKRQFIQVFDEQMRTLTYTYQNFGTVMSIETLVSQVATLNTDVAANKENINKIMSKGSVELNEGTTLILNESWKAISGNTDGYINSIFWYKDWQYSNQLTTVFFPMILRYLPENQTEGVITGSRNIATIPSGYRLPTTGSNIYIPVVISNNDPHYIKNAILYIDSFGKMSLTEDVEYGTKLYLNNVQYTFNYRA